MLTFQRKLQRLVFSILLVGSSTALYATPEHIYLSRHMHKLTGDNPSLSPCGNAQALLLANYLKEQQLGLVLHSGYKRTQETAEALQAPGRVLQVYDARNQAALLAQVNASEQNVVVIGHSNTIPALASAMSGQPIAALHEQDYGRVYHYHLANGQRQLDIIQLPTPTICQTVSRTTLQ